LPEQLQLPQRHVPQSQPFDVFLDMPNLLDAADTPSAFNLITQAAQRHYTV
jgi:hypothetical protein